MFGCVQVIRRLRERGEPVRLFGESDYDAFQRLRKIEILAPEVNKVIPSCPVAIFILLLAGVFLFNLKFHVKAMTTDGLIHANDGLVHAN